MAGPYPMGAIAKGSVHSTMRERTEAMGVGTTVVSLDRDTYALARSGKKQVLKRRFGLFSMTGLAIATMISWEGSIVNLGLGLQNGGPAGIIYGTILTWLGTLSVFISMGELSSMIPTAGGQYHWASVLAPPRVKNVVSYITGWVTVATWIAAPTAVSYLTATITLELISFLQPSYTPQPYQGTLVMWGVLALAVFVNTVLGAMLPLIELTFLTLHIVGFLAMLIPLAFLGPHGDAHEIFTKFDNAGGWATKGLAFFVGLQGDASAILGTDCAIHMAEEVQKADVNVALSMVISVALNGAMMFVMNIVFLYFAGPLDTLLKTSGQYPFINIIFNATQSRGATAALVGFIIFMNFAASVSTVSSGSRMVWSFARDQGLPFWRYLRRVDRRYAIPMVAICVVVTCSALLGIIQIGSHVAFEDVISLVIEGFFSSYLCVLIPLLYHRVKGNIDVPPLDDAGRDKSDDKPYQWGPFRLPGILGTINNIVAILYLVVVGFFSFWPPSAQVDAKSMNYSSLVLGGVAILSSIYYMVWARRTYSGPIAEVEAERM